MCLFFWKFIYIENVFFLSLEIYYLTMILNSLKAYMDLKYVFENKHTYVYKCTLIIPLRIIYDLEVIYIMSNIL